jgi:two-component sensor histidine kinase
MSELQSDTAKANSAQVVIEEAITNAMKHAGAENVAVAIARVGDAFELTVTNDVHKELKSNPTGFGSKTYDAMTRNWQLVTNDRQAVLHATL